MLTTLAIFTVHKQETVYNRMLQSCVVLRYRCAIIGLNTDTSSGYTCAALVIQVTEGSAVTIVAEPCHLFKFRFRIPKFFSSPVLILKF
jgi:hypothetical protein